MRASAFVGRVGGLAVALGIGAAVGAVGSGTGWASPDAGQSAEEPEGSVVRSGPGMAHSKRVGPVGGAPVLSAGPASNRGANGQRAGQSHRVAVAERPRVTAVVVVSPAAAGGVPAAVSGAGSAAVPEAPQGSAASVEMLAAARREQGAGRPVSVRASSVASAEQVAPSFDQIIQYTLFHRSATASPVQASGQSGSVVTGSLNAVTANGAPLAFSVVQAPAGGSVEVRPDGSYVYTAGTSLAQSGGTDSFRVAIDNGVPFRLTGIGGAIQGLLSGFAQLFGLRQPDVVTVTVPVTVSALSLDADGTLSVVDLDALARANAVGASVNEAGLVTALVGSFTTTKVSSAADAREVLNRVGGLLGANGSFTGDISVQTAAGETLYRLNQEVDGIPVLGGEVVLSTMQDGTATGVFSGIDPRIYQVNTTPDAGLDNAAEATAAATRILLSRISNPPAGFAESLSFDPRLVIYAMDPVVAPALAWQVDVRTTSSAVDTGLPIVSLSGLQFSTTYYVYANGSKAGTLLAEQDGVQGAALAWDGQSRIGWTESGLNGAEFKINYVGEGGNWAMVDPVRGIFVFTGAELTRDGLNVGTLLSVPKNPVSFARGWFEYPAAVSAMGNVAKAYDFYTALGAALPDQVNVALLVPKGPIEAFGSVVTFPEGWYADLAGGGGVLQFGDGAEGALDFVGHEMTHAAINSIVGVDGFSGFEGDALDEGFGDIMGSLIENKSDAGRWKFSEDAPIVEAATGNEFLMRSMTQISDLYQVEGDPGEKYDKSTEFSNAAYRMMTDTRTADISRETWAQVFYSAIKRLPKNATFDLARSAVIGAAWDQLMAEIEATGDEAEKEALGRVFGSKMKAIADAFNNAGIRAEDPRVKIVLRWGENPSDLDAHLTVPASVTGTVPFDLFAGAPQFWESGAAAPSVVLDTDDRTSYGPEAITINKLAPGEYTFSVYDYSNFQSTDSTALSRSKAFVEVFTPDVQEIEPEGFGYLFRYLTGNIPTTFEVDGYSDGTRWDVFKLTIPAGTPAGGVPVPVITPINTYSYLNSANRAPIVVSTALEVDSATGVVTGSVIATDPEGNYPLRYSVSDDVDHGRVGISRDEGTFTYYPGSYARESNNPTYEVRAAVTGLDRPTRVVFGRGAAAYVVGAGGITTIDTATNTQTGTIPTAPFTVQLVEANPGGTRAYFTAYGQNVIGGNIVGVFTPGANTIAAFKDFVDRVPTAIGFSPGGELVYVATVGGDRRGSLSVLNASSGADARAAIPFDNSASAMAVSRDGLKVYLPGNDANGHGVLTVVNILTGKSSTITGLDSPNDIVITPDGNRLFVTTNSESGGSVWGYDLETESVFVNETVTPGIAGYLATSPDGSRIYASVCVPWETKSAIVVLNNRGSVVKSVDFDAHGALLFPAPAPDGLSVYVPDKTSTVAVMNTAPGDLTDTFVVTVTDTNGATTTVPITVPITPAA